MEQAMRNVPPSLSRALSGALSTKLATKLATKSLSSVGNESEQRTTDNGQRTTTPRIVVLPCLRRFDDARARLVRLTPGWAWRWGLKSGYGWEQFSFWLRLWPKLKKGRYDILHVQDPMLAWWCRKFRKLGLVGTTEILAHGTEEPAQWLRQFEYVQHLAPWHLANSELGTRNCGTRKLGTRNSELGTGSKELGTRNAEQRELGTRNSELGKESLATCHLPLATSPLGCDPQLRRYRRVSTGGGCGGKNACRDAVRASGRCAL